MEIFIIYCSTYITSVTIHFFRKSREKSTGSRIKTYFKILMHSCITLWYFKIILF